MYEHDERIVMTLDAGGTNFVFSAIQGCREIVEPICLPAASDDLERCLSVLVEGFLEVEKRLPKLPVAISFAFPGPADYEHGIIGDLPNFPAFRGGVAGAAKYILPGIMNEMNRQIGTFAGASFPCLQMEVFNLSEKEAFDKFLEEKDKMVKIPFSEREVHYACHKKIGIAVSTLGASRAVALGAYSFALSQLNIL